MSEFQTKFEMSRMEPTVGLEPTTYSLPACRTWSHPSDSNRRPTVYKTVALPTELGWPASRAGKTVALPTELSWLVINLLI